MTGSSAACTHLCLLEPVTVLQIGALPLTSGCKQLMKACGHLVAGCLSLQCHVHMWGAAGQIAR